MTEINRKPLRDVSSSLKKEWIPYDSNNSEHNDPNKYKIIKKGNVFDHTIACIKAHDRVNYSLLNLAALFHDVGKPVTHAYNEKGIVTYITHEKVGVDIGKKICQRLKISNDDTKAILFVIENHMVFHKLEGMKDSKLFKLIDNTNFLLLYNVAYNDDMCRGVVSNPDRWIHVSNRIEELQRKFKGIKNLQALKQIINGEKIMSLCNISPGPEVGRIQKYVIDYIINNDVSIQEISVIDDIILKFKQAQ